jgi:FOG: CheY-like receiver
MTGFVLMGHQGGGGERGRLARRQAPPEENHGMLTPVKLLLIDDQPSFVRGLTRLLQRDGYTVETAAHGQEALARLTAHPYDVIVCDLQMPARDGRTFYDLLQRQFPSLCQRVMFVTGDALGVDSTACLAQCGQPSLYKPCTVAAVRSTMQQTLHAMEVSV